MLNSLKRNVGVKLLTLAVACLMLWQDTAFSMSAPERGTLAPVSRFAPMARGDDVSFRDSALFHYVAVLIGQYLRLGISEETIRPDIRDVLGAIADRVGPLTVSENFRSDPLLAGVVLEDAFLDETENAFYLPVEREAAAAFAYRFSVKLPPAGRADMAVRLDDGTAVYVDIRPVSRAVAADHSRGPASSDVAARLPASVRELIDSAVESARSSGDADIFEIVQAGEDIRLDGNRQEIFRAVSNLLENARDAVTCPGMPTSRARVIITLETHDTFVRITVADNGPGMTETAAKAFNLSNEPPPSTKGAGRGSGIGIANDLVRRNGGYMYVISEEGRGAAFTIHLPVSPAHQHTREFEEFQGRYPGHARQNTFERAEEYNTNAIPEETLQFLAHMILIYYGDDPKQDIARISGRIQMLKPALGEEKAAALHERVMEAVRTIYKQPGLHLGIGDPSTVDDALARALVAETLARCGEHLAAAEALREALSGELRPDRADASAAERIVCDLAGSYRERISEFFEDLQARARSFGIVAAPGGSHRAAAVEEIGRFILDARERERSRSGTGKIFIGFEGFDASGKSSLVSRELAPHLASRGVRCVIVKGDWTMVPKAEREADPVRYGLAPGGVPVGDGFGGAAYYNWFRYDDKLIPWLGSLRQRGRRELPAGTAVYDSAAQAYMPLAAPVVVDDETVVLVDGLFLQRPGVRELLDRVVYVDISEEESLRRQRERDPRVMGRTTAEVDGLVSGVFLPAHRRYLASIDPMGTADMVVDNNDLARPLIRSARSASGSPARCLRTIVMDDTLRIRTDLSVRDIMARRVKDDGVTLFAARTVYKEVEMLKRLGILVAGTRPHTYRLCDALRHLSPPRPGVLPRVVRDICMLRHRGVAYLDRYSIPERALEALREKVRAELDARWPPAPPSVSGNPYENEFFVDRSFYTRNATFGGDIAAKIDARLRERPDHPVSVLMIGIGRGFEAFELMKRYGSRVIVTAVDLHDLVYRTAGDLADRFSGEAEDIDVADAAALIEDLRSRFIRADLNEGIPLEGPYDIVMMGCAVSTYVERKIPALLECVRLAGEFGAVYADLDLAFIGSGAAGRVWHPASDYLARHPVSGLDVFLNGGRITSGIRIIKKPGFRFPRFEEVRSEPYWDWDLLKWRTYYYPVHRAAPASVRAGGRAALETVCACAAVVAVSVIAWPFVAGHLSLWIDQAREWLGSDPLTMALAVGSIAPRGGARKDRYDAAKKRFETAGGLAEKLALIPEIEAASDEDRRHKYFSAILRNEDDPELLLAAGYGLSRLGDAGHRALTAALKTGVSRTEPTLPQLAAAYGLSQKERGGIRTLTGVFFGMAGSATQYAAAFGLAYRPEGVPALWEGLRSAQTFHAALYALARGPDAVSNLQKAFLKAPDIGRRMMVGKELVALGPAGVEALQGFARTGEGGIRDTARAALSAAGIKDTLPAIEPKAPVVIEASSAPEAEIPPPTAVTESARARQFSDEVVLAERSARGAARTVLAVGRGVLPGYKKSGPLAAGLNDLVRSIADRCRRHSIELLIAPDEDLAAEIAARKAAGFRVIALADIGNTAAFDGLYKAYASADGAGIDFLAGVDTSSLDESRYICIMELLATALRLASNRSAHPGGLVDLGADARYPAIPILIPRAQPLKLSDDAIRALYQVQQNA